MALTNSSISGFPPEVATAAYIFHSKKKPCHCPNPLCKKCIQTLAYEDITSNTVALDCFKLPPSVLLHTGLVESSAHAMICAPAPPNGNIGIRLDAAGSVQSLLSNFDIDPGTATPFSAVALVAFASAFWYRRKYQRAMDGYQRSE